MLVKGAVERVLELCAAQMLPNGGTQRLDRDERPRTRPSSSPARGCGYWLLRAGM